MPATAQNIERVFINFSCCHNTVHETPALCRAAQARALRSRRGEAPACGGGLATLSGVSIRLKNKASALKPGSMKERATVVCWQRGRILLVERGRSRWSLPGGTIRRDESPADAAWRELSEETTLEGYELGYLFHFGGINKQHHVFFSLLPDEARPAPNNEILRCRWFRPRKVETLITSVPTREIVNLLFNREAAASFYAAA
jgi:8-oxo-dGTP diphosphatase